MFARRTCASSTAPLAVKSNLERRLICWSSRVTRWRFRLSQKIRTCWKRFGRSVTMRQRRAIQRMALCARRSRTHGQASADAVAKSAGRQRPNFVAKTIRRTHDVRRGCRSFAPQSRARISQGTRILLRAHRLAPRLRRLDILQSRVQAVDWSFAVGRS